MTLILDDKNDTVRVLTDAELDAMEAADLARLTTSARHWLNVEPIQSPSLVSTPIRSLSLATLAECEANRRAKLISHDDRNDGRVISPRLSRPNIHD